MAMQINVMGCQLKLVCGKTPLSTIHFVLSEEILDFCQTFSFMSQCDLRVRVVCSVANKMCITIF